MPRVHAVQWKDHVGLKAPVVRKVPAALRARKDLVEPKVRVGLRVLAAR